MAAESSKQARKGNTANHLRCRENNLNLRSKPHVDLWLKLLWIRQYTAQRGYSMTDSPKERWEELAEQVAKEQNTDKIIELTKELNKALAERDAKIKGQKSSAA